MLGHHTQYWPRQPAMLQSWLWTVCRCLVASPGRIMSCSMRRKRYMLHSNGPQVIAASQWSAVNVIFGRKNRRCIHHGGKRRMSQAVRTARCRTPPTFAAMARSRREIDTAAMHWTACRRCERTLDTTIDVDMRCNREAGVGKGKKQRESTSLRSFHCCIRSNEKGTAGASACGHNEHFGSRYVPFAP